MGSSAAQNLQRDQKKDLIRLSIGSANELGLVSVKSDEIPTTCYLMTPELDGCRGICEFCPQSSIADGNRRSSLSRIQWPLYSFSEVLEKIRNNLQGSEKNRFQRICLQVLLSKNFASKSISIIHELHSHFPKLPISAAVPPVSKTILKKLKQAGLERIGISMDAASKNLFQKIKGEEGIGPYSWDTHLQALEEALDIFGQPYVTTHLIIGLGEKENQSVEFMHKMLTKGITVGLFCFTPIKGTPLEDHPRPPIEQFRRNQLARFLMLSDISNFNRFHFDKDGCLTNIDGFTVSELWQIIRSQTAFQTSGCPACNRPYYTSSPGEEQDGYPSNISPSNQRKIYLELNNFCFQFITEFRIFCHDIHYPQDLFEKKLYIQLLYIQQYDLGKYKHFLHESGWYRK